MSTKTQNPLGVCEAAASAGCMDARHKPTRRPLWLLLLFLLGGADRLKILRLRAGKEGQL